MNALQEQIELAKAVKAHHHYTTTAAIVASRLTARSKKVFYGFRFSNEYKIGDTINNQDGSVSEVVALI